MIMILAFAVWSLLLAVVAAATGVALLMYIATAIGALAAGFAFLVLIVSVRTPDPRAEHGFAPRMVRARPAMSVAS
jgi:hypothetical protein